MRFKKHSKDRKEWIIVPHPELRIVDDELWEKAQANAKQNTRAHFGNGPKRASFVLTSLVVCGACGKPGGGHWQQNADGSNRYHYYRCRAAMNGKGQCTNKAKIRGIELEAAVVEAIEKYLLPEDALEKITDEILLLKEAEIKTGDSAEDLQQRVRRLTEEIERLTDLALRVPDLTDVAEKLKIKSQERDALVKKLRQVANPGPPPDRDQIREEVRARLHHTLDVVKNTDFDAELRMQLKRIVQEIRVDPDGQVWLKWHPDFLAEVTGVPAVSLIMEEGSRSASLGHSDNPLLGWKLLLSSPGTAPLFAGTHLLPGLSAVGFSGFSSVHGAHLAPTAEVQQILGFSGHLGTTTLPQTDQEQIVGFSGFAGFSGAA